MEILKQGQFSPVAVEKQVAIIYAGVRGLFRSVPVNKVKEFEAEFLSQLEARYPQVLADLRAGKYTDEITGKLEEVSKDVSGRYAK